MADRQSPLIEAKALLRLDERHQAALLQSTDFQLYPGDRVAITGASGSGKSVLLRALALLDTPTSGQILWHNQALAHARIPTYRSRVCYLSQRPALLDGTVEDNLRFPYSLTTWRHLAFDRQRVCTLLAHAGKAPGFLSKNAGDLSGGEAQVLSLIRTLQSDPDVLLLDEPTAALDPASSGEVEALVRNWFDSGNAHAYIWVSHDHEQAQRMGARRLHMDTGVLSGVGQA